MKETFENLISKVKANNPNADTEKIRRAYELACDAHKDQKRISGTPYITHPLAVATIVADMQMDVDSVCAALLHDVVEDTAYSIDDIKERFGEQVALLVDGVTKLDKISFQQRGKGYGEPQKNVSRYGGGHQGYNNKICRPYAQPAHAHKYVGGQTARKGKRNTLCVRSACPQARYV